MRPRTQQLLLAALLAGALGIAVLVVAGPGIYRRVLLRIPAVSQWEFRKTLAQRKAMLSHAHFQGPQAHVFAGDSHIEMGNWASLCEGRVNIHNIGLTMSRITDIETLISVLPKQKVNAVVLLCGINDLTGGETVEVSLPKYRRLVELVREKLEPQELVILSVMPVHAALIQNSATVNPLTVQMNKGLQQLCREANASFVDVSSAVSAADGSLDAKFTVDGLHLNAHGYRVIGSIVCKFLTRNQP